MTETINQFGKNIALNCGFDLGAKSLLDSRSIVKDAAELDAIPDIRRANGLLVWIQDEKKLVAWDEPGQAWVEVSGDKFDSTEIEERLQNLDSELINLDESFRSYKDYIDDNWNERFYDDKEYKLATAHGGLKAGMDVKGMKIIDILKKILFPFQAPKISLGRTDLNGEIFKLGCGEAWPFSIKVEEGDVALQPDKFALKVNGKDHYTGTVASINGNDDIDVAMSSITTFVATGVCAAESDNEDAADYLGKTISSNTITCYGVRPLYFAWSTDMPTWKRAIMDYYNGTDNGVFAEPPACVLTRDKSATLKFSGYGKDSRMVIISPYKIKTIKNPSGFDITSSFSVEQDFLSRGGGDAMPTTWPQEVIDAYSMTEVYCYTSNVTNQSKAYPLTVTFE